MPDRITTTLDFKTHTSNVAHKHDANLFCPYCGTKAVWVEDSGGGDYYLGECHLCVSCGAAFSLQSYAQTYEYEASIKNIREQTK